MQNFSSMHEQATEAGLSQIALLDHILSSVSDGIHVIDMNGTVLVENDASARMLGWCNDCLVGKPWHAAIHHHHADGREFRSHGAVRDYASTARAGVGGDWRDGICGRCNGLAARVRQLTLLSTRSA